MAYFIGEPGWYTRVQDKGLPPPSDDHKSYKPKDDYDGTYPLKFDKQVKSEGLAVSGLKKEDFLKAINGKNFKVTNLEFGGVYRKNKNIMKNDISSRMDIYLVYGQPMEKIIDGFIVKYIQHIKV